MINERICRVIEGLSITEMALLQDEPYYVFVRDDTDENKPVSMPS